MAIEGMDKYAPGHASARDLLIKTTSGTTGIPKLLLTPIIQKVTERDGVFEALIRLTPRYGLRFVYLRRLLLSEHSTKKRVLFLDPMELNHPSLAMLVSEFAPTDIIGSPSLIILFLGAIKRAQEEVSSTVRRVFLGAEIGSKSQVDKVRKIFPQSDVLFAYNASETGPIGTGCPYLLKYFANNYALSPVHPNTSCKITISEPDGEGVGGIIASTEEREGHPTGDLGKLIDESCLCGKRQTLLVYGRANYDIVHCVGATFFSSEIKRVFDEVSEYVRDYAVEVREKYVGTEARGEVTYIIVPTEKLRGMRNPEEYVINAIEPKLFVTKTRTLAALVEQGIFLLSKIEFTDSLPQQNKKMHLRKVFD